jgi:hypothetical protein
MSRRRLAPGPFLYLLLAAAPASAHFERAVSSPIRPGPVPDLARGCAERLVVCKASSRPTVAELLAIVKQIGATRGSARAQARAELRAWQRNRRLFPECRYEHIQDAVDDAGSGACILVMPGVYLEEPSRAVPTSGRGDNPDGSYSYEYQLANPNDANLVAIVGKHDVTLEGTGADPRDVAVDAGFAKDVVIRGDRADGIIVRNLWAKDSNEHAIYVIETDGYVFDRTVGSFARDYELFSTASDNGLFTDCEAEGGGDSGLYIGQSPDTRAVGRFSAEVRRCLIHHNALGFSGTQGNSVWMHDNEFTDNSIGISYDTENDHVNAPQRASLIEDNHVHHNNFEIYAADSDVPIGGPGRDFFRYPVGTGMWIIGGEDNRVRRNRIHDNQRFGVIVANNPLEGPVPAAVHGNQFVDNRLGAAAGPGAGPNSTAFPPGGDYAPGGSDFYWDESGNDNCWGPNSPARTDPPELPGPCPFPNQGLPETSTTPEKLALLASCQLVRVPGSNPPRFRTLDLPHPCPWGGVDEADPRSGAQRECGNGALDLGEQCDPALASGESCASLGHGGGALACDPFCTFDTGGCEAPSCGRVGPGRASWQAPRGGRRGAEVELQLDAVAGAGRSFDPRSEAVELVLRDETGLVHAALVPAGSRGWSSGADGGLVYEDPAGRRGGLRRLALGGAPEFTVSAVLRGRAVLEAPRTRTLGAVLRVADDCWSADLACRSGRGGGTLRCERTVDLP